MTQYQNLTNPPAPANPLLENLADIHLPETISYWPPAPGWWILLVLLLIGLFFGYRFISAYRARLRYRQALLKELQAIERHWHKQSNIIVTASKLSQLLRRYCMSQDSRGAVAGRFNQDWYDYLNQRFKPIGWNERHKQLLLELPYQDPLIKFDMEQQNLFTTEIDQLLSKLKVIFKSTQKPNSSKGF